MPPHYEPPVEWIPLAQIRPVQSRAQSAAQSLREPSLTCYPALVVKPCGADFVLCDGHRRYYALKDAGWSGSVPVVRLRRG